jgi:hypothetical protein
VERYFFKYAGSKEALITCPYWIAYNTKLDFKKRREYELAHAEAVMLARSQNKTTVPALKQKETETEPPNIALSDHTNKTDAFQTFIRGRVTDNEGVITVLVNGKKAGVKAEGTFAAKLKLAFGANKILVQAEDINGNVAEKAFTIIREEFIPDTVLADVDIPKKTKMNNPDGVAPYIGVILAPALG